MIGPRLIARVAVFSAIVYVTSWSTSFLPNVNLVFFIVFTAGFIWGTLTGMLVGVVGMGLWTTFNPYGVAMPPIMLAQVVGAGLTGLIGSQFGRLHWQNWGRFRLAAVLVGCSIASSLMFYLPVTVVDAWLFQPFWPRFISGLLWVAVSLVSNAIIFPLLFPVARPLYDREMARA